MFCYGLSRRTHADTKIQNRRHLPPFPHRQPTWGGQPRPTNNTRKIINQNDIPELHAISQRLLIYYRGYLQHQTHWQLPGLTGIHWQPMPHCLQDLPEGHEHLTLLPTPLWSPIRSTACNCLWNPTKILGTKQNMFDYIETPKKPLPPPHCKSTSRVNNPTTLPIRRNPSLPRRK